jgi:hypothetical protein
MRKASKKTATKKISGESVQTNAAQSSQQQTTTTPDGTTPESASGVAGTKATTTAPQSITVAKKVPFAEKQYLKAIDMSDAELGEAIKKPTQALAKYVGDAIAHEEKAKASRAKAQAEFEENIAYYYEAKQRLLNPGYRTDLNGGKDRTPSQNGKNFGAPDWATFNENCAAYSLQHADRKLKRFAKANGLLTDGGENIDDPEEGRIDEAETDGASSEHRPQGRRKEDATAQRRYEFIALAAMDIANKNPEGEAEKQILAAAEHVPAPLMPLPPDIFTEVLSFITQVSSSDKDDNIRAEAKKLLNKMLLHKPAPDPAKVLEEATKEETRKRDTRLAKKNGRALGSASYNPPTNGTSEDVQKSEPSPDRDTESSANRETAAVTLKPSAAQSPLKPGKKYTVRPAPSGGSGIYEVGSPICLQKHPTTDAAWDAIDGSKQPLLPVINERGAASA